MSGPRKGCTASCYSLFVVSGTPSSSRLDVRSPRPGARGREDLPYEERLRREPQWAMAESDRFFQGNSSLHETLRNLNAKLDEHGIPYVVIGGMAVTAHGFAGMTGGPHRAKDIVDVQQLIKLLQLPRSVDNSLHEYVRSKYDQLWDELQA